MVGANPWFMSSRGLRRRPKGDWLTPLFIIFANVEHESTSLIDAAPDYVGRVLFQTAFLRLNTQNSR